MDTPRHLWPNMPRQTHPRYPLLKFIQKHLQAAACWRMACLISCCIGEIPGLQFGVNPHRLSISRFAVDMGDNGPFSGPPNNCCCSSRCWHWWEDGITVWRGINELGKPNTMEWSRSADAGERGEKVGGVGGKLPGGVIHPPRDWHAVGQLILDIRFLPCEKVRKDLKWKSSSAYWFCS